MITIDWAEWPWYVWLGCGVAVVLIIGWTALKMIARGSSQ